MDDGKSDTVTAVAKPTTDIDNMPITTPIISKKVVVESDFPNAMRLVMNGKKMTRREWGSKDIYIFLNEGRLCINMENKLHTLTVSDGDMFAKDWIIVEETN